MLLCPVKGTSLGQGAENVARDVALEAAENLALGEALGGAPAGVCLSALVAAHPGHGDPPEGTVSLAVASLVEPVAGGFARGSGQRCNTAEGREGRLGTEPLGIVASHDQEGAGDLGTDTGQRQ